ANNYSQEEIIITIDWDALSTGHNTNGVSVNDYIVVPSNLFYNRSLDFEQPIKILYIGNSISTDSAEYLFDICQSVGVNIIVGVIFDSGMGLEQTWNKLQNNETVTAYQKWTSGKG